MSVSDDDFERTGATVTYKREHHSPHKFAWRAAEACIRQSLDIENLPNPEHDGDEDRDIEIKSAVKEQRDGSEGCFVFHLDQHRRNVVEGRNYLLAVVDVVNADTWRVMDVAGMPAKRLDRVLDIPERWTWSEDEGEYIVRERWGDVPYLHRPGFYRSLYDLFAADDPLMEFRGWDDGG